MKQITFTIALISTITALALTFPRSKNEPDEVPKRPHLTAISRNHLLVVGSVSVKPKEEVATFQPLADYLAAHLSDHGILKGKVAIAKSPSEMAEMFRRGEIDIYIDSPFPVARVDSKAEVVPLLRRWKKGCKEYYSVIVVRNDSGIESVSDLQGKVVAFDEAFSTAGYLLPKAALINRGAKFRELTDQNSTIPPGQVGYVFSTDDETTLFWILRKKVSAGAFSIGTYQRLAKEHDSLKILLKSVVVPRHLVVHRADMHPSLVLDLKNTLLEMNDQTKGKEVLQAFEKTTKFDDFPKSLGGDFQTIQKLLQEIEQ